MLLLLRSHVAPAPPPDVGAPPPNLSALTATLIGPLPYAVTQDVNNGATTELVWYKLIAEQTGVISLFGFGDLLPSGYAPGVEAWQSDGVTSYLNIAAVNVPIQFPVVQGETYYFSFYSDNGNVDPAILTLTLEYHASESLPDNAIFVNDDLFGFPAAVLDPVDGHVVRFFPDIPAGEYGDVLNDGTILINAILHSGIRRFYLYEASLTLLAEITGFVFTGSQGLVASNAVDRFYLGDGDAPPRITTVDPTSGALGGTIWTLTGLLGLKAIGVSRDGTILYINEIGSTNQPIKRWSLAGAGSALSNLAAGIANYQALKDVLVLADDTILVAYAKTSAPKAFQIKHYSAAGAVLHTYTFADTLGSTVVDNRLARAVEDPASFWVWIHVDDGADTIRGRYVHVRISDGVELASVPSSEFQGGRATIAPTATPARFGHSESCPFLILRSVADVPDDGGNGGGGGGGGGDDVECIPERPSVACASDCDVDDLKVGPLL